MLVVIRSVVRLQNFDGCDIQKELKPGIVYTLVSPNYKNPYASGTFCRYSGNFYVHL